MYGGPDIRHKLLNAIHTLRLMVLFNGLVNPRADMSPLNKFTEF